MNSAFKQTEKQQHEKDRFTQCYFSHLQPTGSVYKKYPSWQLQ